MSELARASNGIITPHRGLKARCGKNTIAPEVPPHEGKHIAKRSRSLVIPGGLFEWKGRTGSEGLPKERHQAVEPQEQGVLRRVARSDHCRSRLQARVSLALLKGC